MAKEVAVLPQAPVTPGAITVADLAARGRFPHQSLLRQWSVEDERAVSRALGKVGLAQESERLVEELSGGQRQRAWIAMALSQDTPIVLLDEPTTFLDLSHQLDVLDLCAELHAGGRTIVTVLHDLNLAARYASHVIAMSAGRIVVEGPPAEVFTTPMLREVFGLDAHVLADPDTGGPLIVPRDRRRGPSPRIPMDTEHQEHPS